MLQRNLMQRDQTEESQSWKMLFHPREFAKDKDFDSFDDWIIKEDKLFKFAKSTNKLRADLRKRAVRMAEVIGASISDSDPVVAKVITNVRNGHWDQRVKKKKDFFKSMTKEPVPSLLRKRGKIRKLSLDDRVEVAWMIFMDKERQVDVAKHFHVTQPSISSLVSRLRKKPNMLSELLAVKESKKADRAAIGDAIQVLIDKNEVIDSVDFVTK